MTDDWSRPPATLIGDLVGSRGAARRGWLHRVLEEILDRVNGATSPVQNLKPTLGDEFQGAFRTVAEAAQASLLIRLELLKATQADSRFGLGYGSTAPVTDRFPAPQDGPGWWSARDALSRAEEMEHDPRTSFVRTVFVCNRPGPEMSAAHAGAINAFLLCRDALVDKMNPRRQRLLLGLLQDRTQADLALEEGISPAAVSQGLSGSAAHAVHLASMILQEPWG